MLIINVFQYVEMDLLMMMKNVMIKIQFHLINVIIVGFIVLQNVLVVIPQLNSLVIVFVVMGLLVVMKNVMIKIIFNLMDVINVN